MLVLDRRSPPGCFADADFLPEVVTGLDNVLFDWRIAGVVVVFFIAFAAVDLDLDGVGLGDVDDDCLRQTNCIMGPFLSEEVVPFFCFACCLLLLVDMVNSFKRWQW